MSLDDHFPADVKKASAVRNIAPGMIIKLEVIMNDGNLHEKRFVIVHVDEITVVCVINSELHPLILNNPSALRCQVIIDSKKHPFMNRDSHIDCSKVWNYQTTAVIESISDRPEWALDLIKATLRDQVVASLKFAPQIAPTDTAVYCA